MLTPGTYLMGRYEILERIGAGGMAEVYKAKDSALNRFVAVKILRQEYCSDETFVRKFRVEAQSAAGLQHPNIVSVYDVGEEKDMHYIIMELSHIMPPCILNISLKIYTKWTIIPGTCLSTINFRSLIYKASSLTKTDNFI